jgi:hypothetical protein
MDASCSRGCYSWNGILRPSPLLSETQCCCCLFTIRTWGLDSRFFIITCPFCSSSQTEKYLPPSGSQSHDWPNHKIVAEAEPTQSNPPIEYCISLVQPHRRLPTALVQRCQKAIKRGSLCLLIEMILFLLQENGKKKLTWVLTSPRTAEARCWIGACI